MPEERSDDSRPTEAKWEAEFKLADLRAARFAERLETELSRNENDPDQIDREAIAHDMGWRSGQSALADFSISEIENGASEGDDDEPEDHVDERAIRLQTIRAYRLGLRIGRQTRALLNPIAQRCTDEETCELVAAIFIAADIATAKIAGGSALGCDDEFICGNIANVRRGVRGIEEGLVALRELQASGVIAPELAREVTALLTQLTMAIGEHIAKLQERVWWE